MAKKVDLQERLNMRFLTVAYKDKQEIYGTCCESSDTGNIALDILNLPDSVLAELLELTDPMMELVDYLSNNRNPNNKVLGMMQQPRRMYSGWWIFCGKCHPLQVRILHGWMRICPKSLLRRRSQRHTQSEKRNRVNCLSRQCVWWPSWASESGISGTH